MLGRNKLGACLPTFGSCADRYCPSGYGGGATNEGDFHEALNMAAIWDLPVVYVCENNLYGASTHLKLVCKLDNLADRALSYGMPSAVCDGNDVLDVYDTVGKAVERARNGGGQTMPKTAHSPRRSRRHLKTSMSRARRGSSNASEASAADDAGLPRWSACRRVRVRRGSDQVDWVVDSVI